MMAVKSTQAKQMAKMISRDISIVQARKSHAIPRFGFEMPPGYVSPDSPTLAFSTVIPERMNPPSIPSRTNPQAIAVLFTGYRAGFAGAFSSATGLLVYPSAEKL